jgi:hypothetical protein
VGKVYYKTIVKKLDHFDEDDFEGDVALLIKNLHELKRKYPEFDSFYLSREEESDYSGGYNTWYAVFGHRKETDKERDKRLAKAKKQRASQKVRREKETKEKEIRERKEYEKLKAKFEG